MNIPEQSEFGGAVKKLTIILSVFGLMLPSIPAFSGGGFSWPMFIPANIGGDRLQNRIKTESLEGCWKFNYTIISDWTTEFCLNKSTIEEPEQSVFFIKGLDSYGNNSVGGYWPEESFYHVLVTGTLFWEYFTFDFIPPSTTAVEGCYYSVDPDNGSLSSCYAMTGYRTSSKITTKSAQPAEINPASQKQQEVAESVKEKSGAAVKKNLSAGISALQESIDKANSSAEAK